MTTSLSTATETPPQPAPGFAALHLSEPVLRALEEIGYSDPTPVQSATYPVAIAGRDLIVQARTGTGKTAAFGIPLVDKIVSTERYVQALVLAPTRELAVQSQREIARIGQFKGLQTVAIYGGAPMGRQIDELQSGAQIVSGTPGRVLDHLRRGTLEPSRLRVLVLDEMDEMLSMGFAKELNAILELIPPKTKRQTMCFSATVDGEVRRHAERHMNEPEMISLSSDRVGVEQITHQVFMVSGADRTGDLVRMLEVEDPESAIIFCNMRVETERVATALKLAGLDADWLNGDLPQRDRERIMASTREGKLRYLVATDVAARGIDISHLTHVINYTFPESAAVYVHRTGRTGRAGRTGCAISLVGPEELGRLYYLRLEYKISPVERSLPTSGERKTRAETDRVALLASAFADAPSATDLAVARRLLSHPDVERVLGGLLHTFFGTKVDVDEEAAAARRTRRPEPVESEAVASAGIRSPGRQDSGRDRLPPPAARGRERTPRGRLREPRDVEPRERDAQGGEAQGGEVRDASGDVRERDAQGEARGRGPQADTRGRDAQGERGRGPQDVRGRDARGPQAERGRGPQGGDAQGDVRERGPQAERGRGPQGGDAQGDVRERGPQAERGRGPQGGDAQGDVRERGPQAERAREPQAGARGRDERGPQRGRGPQGDARGRGDVRGQQSELRGRGPQGEREAMGEARERGPQGELDLEGDARVRDAQGESRERESGASQAESRGREPQGEGRSRGQQSESRARPPRELEPSPREQEDSGPRSLEEQARPVREQDVSAREQQTPRARAPREIGPRGGQARERNGTAVHDQSSDVDVISGESEGSAPRDSEPRTRERSEARRGARRSPAAGALSAVPDADAGSGTLPEDEGVGTGEADARLSGLLYLNLGKRDGVRVGELARLLRESCELSRADIGRIRVRDRYTLVDVPEERLELIISSLTGQLLNERTLAPERAKTAKT